MYMYIPTTCYLSTIVLLNLTLSIATRRSFLLQFLPQPLNISSELSKIRKIDPSFKVDDFIVGAKKAFEYIIKKYSDENIKPLEKLLSADIFKMFSKQINNRAKKKETRRERVPKYRASKIHRVWV